MSLTFCLFSCNKASPENETHKSDVKDQPAEATNERPGLNHFISDSSNYNQVFLKELADYNEPYKLIDNFIQIGSDSIYFPEDLPLKQATIFRGRKDDQDFRLTITRVNLTDIMYSFELKKNGSKIHSESGKAILGPMFFLASENDVDTETGDGYGSSEYWDNSKACGLAIRIGMEQDDNGRQRAVITYGCPKSKNPKLDLEECPTLRAN